MVITSKPLSMAVCVFAASWAEFAAAVALEAALLALDAAALVLVKTEFSAVLLVPLFLKKLVVPAIVFTPHK
jgi:hypothetical protein